MFISILQANFFVIFLVVSLFGTGYLYIEVTCHKSWFINYLATRKAKPFLGLLCRMAIRLE